MSDAFDDLRMDVIDIDRNRVVERFHADMANRIPEGMSFRELTQNAIEAYTRNQLKGDVVWAIEDVEEGERWCLIDTGPGMSPNQVVSYLGRIGGTGGQIGTAANHGIGGKQAGLRDHPEGVAWLSLKDGMVTRALLRIGTHSNRPEFGYESDPLPDVEDLLPEDILSARHGTKVYFPKGASIKSRHSRHAALGLSAGGKTVR